MENTDEVAERYLSDALAGIDAYYKQRGIFQGQLGFGKKPAIVVVDFAYGWTDDSYAGGSRRLDEPVRNTQALLEAARLKAVPIIYTTSPYRPETGDQPFKTAADSSPQFREWDRRAVEIDERVAPQPQDYVIEKESASAFAGTHLAGYLIQQQVDTLLITGCTTSACIRATATDAKSLRFLPTIISDCVGDRVALTHVFTLFDVQARFSDVRPLEDVLTYLDSL